MKSCWSMCPFLLMKTINTKRAYRGLKLQYLIILVFSLVTGVAYYELVYKDQGYHNRDVTRILEQRLHEEILLEKGTGCQMPKLDAFDKDAMKFWSSSTDIVCEGTDWVRCNLTECWVVQNILDKYNNVVCNYENIIYEHDHSYYIAEPVKVSGNNKYILARSDHVRVKCSAKAVGFSLLPPKWVGYNAGFRPISSKTTPPGREKGMNVLILCFDSTSHNHFRRSMPKSYKVLTDELNAVALNSYNIVGDGTRAALFPMFTGKSEWELPDARKTMTSNKIDPNNLIFHLMHLDGYRTAYFEDMPWVGTFQYRHNGFNRQPADHYLRAFFLEESKMHRKLLHGGYKHSYCVGARPQYKFMLDLTDQFFLLEGKKFCFTFIADISHDDNNMIGAADDDVAEFLRSFKARGRLQNTLLVVMGDHGSRQTELRSIYQGRIEERLPLLTIVLPEKFKKERPRAESALRSNVDVLTTPFDIHTTLLDYAGLKQYCNDYKIPGADFTRGLSLLEPISNTRSCSEAGVMVHWCACSRWLPVLRGDRMFRLVSNTLADFINNITKEQRALCANRSLLYVEWVMKQSSNEAVMKNGPSKYIDGFRGNPSGPKLLPANEFYQAKIIMSPGRAHYEGSVRYRVKHNNFVVSERDISRTNIYGDQPACVSATHPHLSKYCYCKDYRP